MTQYHTQELAPELEVDAWLNTDTPLSLLALRGKVVLIEAFQMLCPACAAHSLPQAKKVAQIFNTDDVAVIGLHTVFEHHRAQGSKSALSAFLHEYRISFPVGIDAMPSGGNIPKTMQKYQMRGTPSLILIDRQGRLRSHKFGQVEDMILGAEIMALVNEDNAAIAPSGIASSSPKSSVKPGCDDDGCPSP